MQRRRAKRMKDWDLDVERGRVRERSRQRMRQQHQQDGTTGTVANALSPSSSRSPNMSPRLGGTDLPQGIGATSGGNGLTPSGSSNRSPRLGGVDIPTSIGVGSPGASIGGNSNHSPRMGVLVEDLPPASFAPSGMVQSQSQPQSGSTLGMGLGLSFPMETRPSMDVVVEKVDGDRNETQEAQHL